MTENENIPEFENTKAFIQRRCQKDHFNYVKEFPIKKMNSLYESSYRYSNQKVQRRGKFDSIAMLSKQKMQNSDLFCSRVSQSNQITPLISRYRQDHNEIRNMNPLQKSKQRPSFFLKSSNIDEMKSEYQVANQKNKRVRDSFKPNLDKQLPNQDNLGVPKYNKLSKNSIYRDSYRLNLNQVKLPSIYQNIPRRSKVL